MEGGWVPEKFFDYVPKGRAGREEVVGPVGTSPARMELHFNYYRGEIVTKRGGGLRLTVLGDP